MKFIGNIACTIAILTQILLSVGLLSHSPVCLASQFDSEPDAAEIIHHDCDCGHHHVASSTNNEFCEITPLKAPHDCT